MAYQPVPYLELLGLAAVAAGLGAAFSWQRRDSDGAVPLAGLMAFAAFWTVAYGLQLATTTLGAKLFWWAIKYVGIVFVPPFWLLFALEYSGRERWLKGRYVAGLFAVPIVQLLVVWTNSVHHWYAEAGSLVQGPGFVQLSNPVAPGFWVFFTYHYLLLLAGTIVIIRLLRLGGRYRSQTAAIFVGVLTPWLANVLFVLGVRPAGLDLTPLAFIVTGLTLGWAVHRHVLLDIVPVPRELARAELLDSISDATFVVDERHQVVEVNPAAEQLVADAVGSPVGRPIGRVLPELADLFAGGVDSSVDQVEVTISREQGTRHLDVRISPLRRGLGAIRGYILIVRDVTDRARHRQRLEVLNRVLRHDIRNDVNLILAHTEALLDGTDEFEHRAERINEIAFDIVEISNRARTFERTLEGEVELEVVELSSVVERTLESVRMDYPDVGLVTAIPESATVTADPFIESAVRNLIENAIEHNNSADPEVTVELNAAGPDGWVTLTVADNGPGIPEDERAVIERGRETQIHHSSGLGLWLVNWIVTESGGEVQFEENEPRGSRITVRLPAAEATG